MHCTDKCTAYYLLQLHYYYCVWIRFELLTLVLPLGHYLIQWNSPFHGVSCSILCVLSFFVTNFFCSPCSQLSVMTNVMYESKVLSVVSKYLDHLEMTKIDRKVELSVIIHQLIKSSICADCLDFCVWKVPFISKSKRTRNKCCLYNLHNILKWLCME